MVSICVFVEDMVTGAIIDPKQQTEYTFTNDVSVDYTNRFTIKFGAIAEKVISPAICGEDAKIDIDLNMKSDYSLFNSLGVLVSKGKAKNKVYLENVVKDTYLLSLANNNLSCGNQHAVKIPGNNPLTVSNIVTQAVTCNNNDGKITVTANGGAGGYTFIWSNNKKGSSISDLSPGNYSITVKDINNCETKAEVTVANSYLIADFSLLKDTFDILGVGSAKLEITNNSLNAINYKWSFGDGEISTIKNPVKTYTQAGIYPVKLLVEAGSNCSDIVTKTVVIRDKLTSITEVSDNGISVYNLGNSIHVNVAGIVPNKLNLRLVDANGRVVESIELEGQSETSNYTINTTNLSAGVYVLSMELDSKTVSRKVTITN